MLFIHTSPLHSQVHDVELESEAMSMPHCFINKVVVFKSKDNTFESPCNLSQCENVEFCLHNLHRLTQNLQWCLFGTWCHPGHLIYISKKFAIQPPVSKQEHEAPFPLHYVYITWVVFLPLYYLCSLPTSILPP